MRSIHSIIPQIEKTQPKNNIREFILNTHKLSRYINHDAENYGPLLLSKFKLQDAIKEIKAHIEAWMKWLPITNDFCIIAK